MLLNMREQGFEDFRKTWEGNLRHRERLEKALRMAFYLVHDIFQISDEVIAHTMSKPLPNFPGKRKIPGSDIKILIKHLQGRELARTKIENREQHYTKVKLTTELAWRLFLALREIAQDGERAIPDFLRNLQNLSPSEHAIAIKKLMSPKAGNQSAVPLLRKRLNLVKKAKSSILNQVKHIFDSFEGNVDFQVTIPDEAIIAFSLTVRREIEREIELMVLSASNSKRFDWMAYLEQRQQQKDLERMPLYPDELRATAMFLSTDDSKELLPILDRFVA